MKTGVISFACWMLLPSVPAVPAQNASTVGGGASGRAEYKNPPGLSKPNGYSHVVVVNGGRLIFFSGQVGLDADGGMVGKGSFTEQVKQALANLKTALSAVGATPASLVKLNYYVVGLDHERLLAVREARDAFIDRQHPPASTLVGVQSLFREDALIEIEAEAVLP